MCGVLYEEPPRHDGTKYSARRVESIARAVGSLEAPEIERLLMYLFITSMYM